MKALLILALAFQGPPVGELPVYGELTAESQIVKIYLSQSEELETMPRMVALQSLWWANGEYVLLIEVNSWDWKVPQPCQLFLTVNKRPLTLPCFLGGSTERLGVRPYQSYITQHLTVKSKKLKSVFRAKSVEMRIFQYKIKLSDKHLRALSSVVPLGE